MKTIVKQGAGSHKAIYLRACNRCGCEFEFERTDVDSTYSDQVNKCNFWYVGCPNCGDATGIEEPKPIRYKE